MCMNQKDALWDRFSIRVWEIATEEMIELLICEVNANIKCTDKVITMGSTGKRDKNNKLIFEGDIVRFYRASVMGLGEERIAQVLWDAECAWYYLLTTLGDGLDLYPYKLEVIGNIYENPALLIEEE